MKKSKASVRYFTLALVALLCFGMLVFRLNAEGEVLLSVDQNTQVSFEEEFNVTIQVDNMLSARNIVGLEFQLNWDPSLLVGVNITEVLYHSVTPESDWSNIWVLANKLDNSAGSVHLAYTFQDVDSAISGGYAPVTGNHTFAVLTLRSLNVSGTSPLNFTFAKAGGYYFDKWGQFITTTVPVNSTGGSVVVKAPSGTIYIRPDGSVDPASAQISTVDNVTYTLTDNVNSDGDGIFIERDNVTLDGAGHVLRGTGIRDSKGVSLVTVGNVTITRMNVESFWEGIYLNGGWQNNIFKNRIADNNVGIDIYSGRHTVTENELVNDDLWCTLGRSNRIFHNNFMNSSAHVARADLGDYNQIWDAGYPLGGNYWSDYNGTDLCSGPNQNKTGSDGIGDTSYGILYYENMDHYPLMKPYAGSHDVGVMSMNNSRNVTGRGCNLTVSIRIINYGEQTEIVNVTLFANSTIFSRIAGIALPSRNSTILTCAWNTTGFTYGTYNITGCISPVSNETDTADNSYCVWVTLTLPGDVDGDFIVNMNDAVALVGAFGSKPGSPDWNANADINGDGIIDIYDAVTLSWHYNQHFA